MLRNMMGDVGTFISLFAVFMLSYAIFIYATLYPLSNYDDKALVRRLLSFVFRLLDVSCHSGPQDTCA